jgi:DNA-binding transcriptional LysR family regulator
MPSSQVLTAFMRPLNWNDYRVLLSIARAESLAGAADLLSLNPTTVSRRIKAMEHRVEGPLVHRDRSGRTTLTPLGRALADHAEQMEQITHAAEAQIGSDTVLSGTVRITAVPFLLNRIVAPRLSSVTAAHPDLSISLIPDPHNLSLTRREVDIALRFAEPKEGGDAVLARRIGTIVFAVFTAKGFEHLAPHARPWLGYDSVAQYLPQAQWTRELARRDGTPLSKLLMHDLETAFETVATSPIRALLPAGIARRDPRLTELSPPAEAPDMTRDVWLLRHADMRGVGRIDAVVNWLADTADLFSA